MSTERRPRIVLSEHVPPGRVFILDPSFLGIDAEGQMIVLHPDHQDAAKRLDELIDQLSEEDIRYWQVMRSVASMEGLLRTLQKEESGGMAFAPGTVRAGRAPVQAVQASCPDCNPEEGERG